MSVYVVGSSEPVAGLTAALVEAGVAARALRLETAGASSASALADALAELERLIADGRPSAVVALGPGDAATAAALVAGKAGIPLLSLLDPGSGPGDEARAVAELSSAHFAVPHDGPGLARAAAQIAEALAAA